MDKSIRKSIRSWLRLPHDTVNAFFHAEVKEGELGVPSLRLTIPILKASRLERLSKSLDPAIVALATVSPNFATEKWKCHNPPLLINNVVVSDSTSAKRQLAASLHGSVDGRGLSSANSVPSVNTWVSDGSALM
ncbi:MAG: hypothetical protein M3H12_06485, partial [Chromatiales bacterium]